MRIIFYIILSLCAVQPCRAAEELVAQPAPVQCQPKSLLARDIVLYDKYQSVLKALAGMPESVELTECINEFRDLTLWAGKKNGRRPKNFVKRVKLLRNVIIESTEISDAVKDDALEALNGIAKKRVGLSRGATWGIGLGSAVVAAALLGCLVIACRRGQRRALVRAEGIDLIEAINTDNVDRVRQLIQQGANVNVIDRFGCTPLGHAIMGYNLEMVRLLIDRGVGVDVIDRFGHTPLGQAATRQDPGGAQMLIERGANVNVIDRFGCTPLFWAALYNNLNTVRLLLEHGATVSFSPENWGDLQRNQEIYDLLRAKEAEDVRWNRPAKQAWMFAVARATNAVASDRLPAR